MPPNPETHYLQFKRVDISLETSDSEATSSAGPIKVKTTASCPSSQTRATSASATSAAASCEFPDRSRLAQHQQAEHQKQLQSGLGGLTSDQVNNSRSRSKSPRPQTLPGLVKSAATESERHASLSQVR